jgi:hypothetical protein
VNPLDRGAVNWGIPEVLKWDFQVSLKMLSDVKQVSDIRPYRNREIGLNEPYRTALRRFYLALDAWVESTDNSYADSDIILNRCINEGPSFCDELKRHRKKSFVLAGHGEFIDDPDWFDEIPSRDIKSIDEIFNYKYLIPWDFGELDVSYFKEEVRIKPEVLQEFKEACFSILPDVDLNLISKEEIALKLSSSSTYDKTPVWESKQEGNGFSRSGMTGRATHVVKGPGDDRTIIILPPDQSNSIRWIDAQTWEVIRHMPGNAMIKNPEAFKNLINEFGREHTAFLCRDIKKEGLTKPRELLLAMGEALRRKYPEVEAFNYFGIYNSLEIKMPDGTKFMACRGHGLGMANCLTTLMQLTISKMAVDRMVSPEGVAMLAYNDDFAAGFTNRTQLDEYESEDAEVLEDLGILHEKQKSFKSRFFVLCETYYPSWFNRKDAYFANEVYQAMACVNISHAKAYMNSIGRVESLPAYERLLDEVISYWGYEFYPEERDLPYCCGGWFSLKAYSVSLDLVSMEDAFCKELFMGYNACKQNLRFRPKKRKGYYNSPFSCFFDALSPPSEEAKDILHIGKKMTKMSLVYPGYKTSRVTQSAWADLFKRRKKAWVGKPMPTISDLREIQDDLMRRVPCDYLPPRSRVIARTPARYYTSDVRLYDEPSPLMSYIASESELGAKNHRPNKFAFLARASIESESKMATNDLRKRFALLYATKGLTILNSEELGFIITDDDQPIRGYINPGMVAVANDFIFGDRLFPIPDWVHPLHNERVKIYGRELSPSAEFHLRQLPEELARWCASECLLEEPEEETIEVALCLEKIMAERALLNPPEPSEEEEVVLLDLDERQKSRMNQIIKIVDQMVTGPSVNYWVWETSHFLVEEPRLSLYRELESFLLQRSLASNPLLRGGLRSQEMTLSAEAIALWVSEGSDPRMLGVDPGNDGHEDTLAGGQRTPGWSDSDEEVSPLLLG